MSAERVGLAVLLAPIPMSLLSPAADRIASAAVVVVMLGVVLVSVVRYVLAERRLERECTRPLEVDEKAEVIR